MSKKLITRQANRDRRRARVRAKVFGTRECPRLNVFRSLTQVFLQLIDDENNKTLASASSKKLVVKGQEAGERKGKTAVAYLAGKQLAEQAVGLGIKKAVFDRAGYRYHGRVAAAADGARDGGLKF
jgi:large subunit ribosomal protein L18